MCLFNEFYKNKKYTATKKNGGIIPAVSDIRTLYVPIGCGHCIECRKQRAREWQVRLMEDIKEHTNGKFITLTFSTESLNKLIKWVRDREARLKRDPFELPKGYDLDNAIATVAIRLFKERWRKHYGTVPRHWLITELGHKNTEHIHLHGILYTDQIHMIDQLWQYGYVWKGKYEKAKKTVYTNWVGEDTINYMTKYVMKMDVIHQKYKPKIFSTPGIGKNYTHRYSHTEEHVQLQVNKKTGERRWYKVKVKKWKLRESGNYKNNKYNEKETDESYRTRSGHKIALPIYWRNKIYNEHEKEQLWLHRLDKNERWVLGTRITDMDKREGELEYQMAVRIAQQHNSKLGYGKPNDWRREKYELQRRILIQATRIK